MSQIVTTFDPNLSTSDTFSAPNSAANGALVFWNESSHRLQITFQDGSNLYVPAWFHRAKCGEIGQVKIQWDIISTLVANFPPVSEVVVEAYQQGEMFPADGPISERQSNIGNAVNLAVAASSIANDGNVAGTSIVEATVGAEVSSAVTWTNDAQLVNGNAAHPGSVQFDNGLISSDGSGHWQVQTLRLLVGGLARISKVTAALSNGKTTVSHGLGTTPDIVLTIARTTSIPTSIISYDPSTITSTHVDIWANGLFNGDIITIKL